MTLIYELDLDILPLDLHAEIQVCMSVCYVRRVGRTHRRTDTQTHTHNAKTITPSADAGCKKGFLTHPSNTASKSSAASATELV